MKWLTVSIAVMIGLILAAVFWAAAGDAKATQTDVPAAGVDAPKIPALPFGCC